MFWRLLETIDKVVKTKEISNEKIVIRIVGLNVGFKLQNQLI